MVIRVLLVCCNLVCCLDNQRGISGVDDSSNILSSNSYETVYDLDISNDRQEACWNETTREKVKMTVTVKIGKQIATNGDGAKAELSLFYEGKPIATRTAKRGRAVFYLTPEQGFTIDNDDYHYLEATAKIKGQPNVLTAFSDGFVFIEDCN